MERGLKKSARTGKSVARTVYSGYQAWRGEKAVETVRIIRAIRDIFFIGQIPLSFTSMDSLSANDAVEDKSYASSECVWCPLADDVLLTPVCPQK
jgi:hypothetical protein